MHVIGFATSDLNTQLQLDSIAAAGGTQEAIFVDNSADLATEMSQIVADSILTELCNGVDDDCDLRVDEGYTLYCNRAGGHPAKNLCADPGETVCDDVDDNCNGQIDEGLLNACGECGATPPRSAIAWTTTATVRSTKAACAAAARRSRRSATAWTTTAMATPTKS